jgi:hypothetical protein
MRARRRGIVLVLVLAMLGLLALVGVTFATLSAQARVNARNYAQSLLVPQDDELMDFALAQLITDTSDPRSVIRGHSLARDMYGNDANGDGFLPFHPSTGLSFFITAAAQVAGPTYTLTTNIVSNDANFYGYNFTRWIMRVSYTGALGTSTGAVDQTLEITADSGFNINSNAFRVFTVAILDTATTLNNPNANVNFPNGYSTSLSGSFLAALVAAGNAANLGVQFPFVLDGRWLRAFNGPGMGSQSFPVTVGALTVNVPFSTYGNFRYNGAIPIPDPNPINPPHFIAGPGAVGMDEDYDACDLENWFMAIQSADGQIMIPSFHRPGIIRVDPGNNVNDWMRQNTSNGGAFLWAESSSRILRPCQADGHDAATFPDLLPDPVTGKITYDVDNDGDGVTDSVWLDLGYPARRDSRGHLYKPLFAFMVIGLNGRIPLNTAGNVAGNFAGTGETHAVHLGNSVSEVDPRYALQNAFDGTLQDQTFAFTPGILPAPNPNTNPDNSQVDSGGIDVRLTQLRNLLSGTRPQPHPLPANAAQFPLMADPNGTTNGDDNFVFINTGAGIGQPYFMPNGIAEVAPLDVPIFTDPNGLPFVQRITPAVPGRWGEPQSIPGSPIPNPSGPPAFGWVTPNYANPVRAGYSQDIGDLLNGTPRDAADDNYNTFDPYPPYDPTTGAQRAGEVDDSELYDAAGAFLLPVDRMRRWVTPADINGTGSIRTWSSAAGGPGLPFGGPDGFGRVEYFSYFRPPGAPGTINVNYTPLPVPLPPPFNTTPTPLVAGTTLGAVYYPTSNNNNFYAVGPNPNNLASAPPQYPYLPDLTNNPLHGFESSKVPNLPGAYGANNAGRGRLFDPQDFGGLPVDRNLSPVPPQPTAFQATAYPTYDFSVNAGPNVRSDGLNEADELNLYTPNPQLDAPFGPADLEWVYRQQDVDGASLSSRLAQLAPISFTNGLDSLRRRRLFSLDSWEFNNFVWANDNPAGVFPNNSLFTPLQNASFFTLNPANPMPSSLAARDKKINLNYPLPVSNSPDEPIRQKWAADAYQLLKVILPPRSVDTPEELAQLSQFVINIIDFRDPDCTMTHFRNPDVEFALGSIAGNPAVYTPPKMYLKGGSPPGSTVIPVDQFGMEYNPIAINEAMAYSFLRKAGNPPVATPTPRFFVELVNTLTSALQPAAAAINAATIDLGANNYDLCITADDPVSRPDPFTGQLLPIVNTAAPLVTVFGPIPFVAPAFPANVTLAPLDPAGPSAGTFNIIGNANPDANAETGAPPLLAAGTIAIGSGFDPTDPNTPAGTPITPAPGALTLDPMNPAMINGVPVGVKNAYPPKPWMTSPPKSTGQVLSYWLCLRRPASPFLPPNPDITGATGPYNPMIVVDSMRFPFIDGGGSVPDPNNDNSVIPGTNAVYSAQRAQPYRGGHAVRLPGDAGTTSAVLNTPYGYSEQTLALVPGVNNLVTDFGQYGTKCIDQVDPNGNPIGHYQTLGGPNAGAGPMATGAAEPWDWFVFHDRDFTSVAELMLVPGCPPGLFTKQFTELPPMPPSNVAANFPPAAATYTKFPVPVNPGGFAFPPQNPQNPPAIVVAPAVPLLAPSAYAYVAPAGGPPQPHTYPYLVDKFFYSGASLPIPANVNLPNPLPANWNYGSSDTFQNSVNTPSSDGWFKMFDFFEVPSQMTGAIGSVAQGTNFDWARQDIKPGLLNLNLIVDEEVFFSVLGKQNYNAGNLPLDPFTQSWLNFSQLIPANEGNVIPQVSSAGLATGLSARSYPMWVAGSSGGVTTSDWLNFTVAMPPPAVLNNNGLKAAFAQFLTLRHGGSGILYGYSGERPFHSLSYPDIDYTVMRPATLPPNANPATSPPPILPAAAPAVPYISGSYAADPGVRNPLLYPGGFGSSVVPPAVPVPYAPGTPFDDGTGTGTALVPNVMLPPPVPALRLFQIPDAYGKTAAYPPPPLQVPPVLPPAPQSNASDSGDPFINVAQTLGALAPVAFNVAGVLTTFYLNNGYPNLVWSGNAPNNNAGVPVQPYLGGAVGGADYRQHPYWRLEMMQRVMNLTTPRTHQYAVWITVGFFEIIRQGDPTMMLANNPLLAYDIIGPEVGAVTGKSIRYRGFFLVDRTKLTGFNPASTGSFRSAVVYRKVIQ